MDVFGGEIRRRDLFPLLVLHLIDGEPQYGNRLIEEIERITEGVISVNPNTIYPLLRQLEAERMIKGSWEHPDRRTRRYYAITAAGRREHERLRRAGAVPRLGDPLRDPDQARALRVAPASAGVAADLEPRPSQEPQPGALLAVDPLLLRPQDQVDEQRRRSSRRRPRTSRRTLTDPDLPRGDGIAPGCSWCR